MIQLKILKILKLFEQFNAKLRCSGWKVFPNGISVMGVKIV